MPEVGFKKRIVTGHKPRKRKKRHGRNILFSKQLKPLSIPYNFIMDITNLQ